MLNSHIQKTDMASIAMVVIANSSTMVVSMMSHSHNIDVVRQIGDDGNSQVDDDRGVDYLDSIHHGTNSSVCVCVSNERTIAYQIGVSSI